MTGVSVDEPTGSRNEAYGRVRGFFTRGQVPFYLDGIPQYVPYDGYVDMNRFLTSDIAEVQISKGYSSPLMGPNALAGSINMVTRQPEKKLGANALTGSGSGSELVSSEHFCDVHHGNALTYAISFMFYAGNQSFTDWDA
jgi:iron complex outermembrane recepter protein